MHKIKFNVIFLVFTTLLLFTYSGVIYLLPDYLVENTKLDTSHTSNLKSLDFLIEKAKTEKATIPNEFLIETLEQFKALETDGNDISHKIIDSYTHFNKALFGILLMHIVALFSFLRVQKT
ncbi:hypothetical protein [Colwellia sp. UCD-KL20]|uniref:hypothetical protein n=1 Tax=Colwellia sp. UCD-KL20 TaxID=1917165 RepID=UPI000971124B|nr:hypothetical protein [Colwellia sp. UCD-KL20]